MSLPHGVLEAVRHALSARLRGDGAALARACLPHAELATLTSPVARAFDPAPLLRELDAVQTSGRATWNGRWLVHAFLGGRIELLVAVQGDDGRWRIDPRYWIAARRPATPPAEAARDFYRALLLGDAAALAELALDPRGLELLGSNPPPAGEHAQLLHVAASVAFAPLALGDEYPTPERVARVEAKHLEHGYTVLLALCPDGELPFLVKLVDGRWKLSAFHFIQAAVLARGGSLGRTDA
ncbi:MAG: hypothetical protein IT457_24415 [Planctomycetes bacterium]|nr:hypothetical protein [Planctomycetota bacterium]